MCIHGGTAWRPLSAGATYDDVTRVTASTAADATAECVFELPGSESNGGGGDSGGGGEVVASGAAATPTPFVFISAAEAKWTFKAPVQWLEEYLVAKRAVETKVSDMTASGKIRGSCLRPSLVYTFDRPQALPAVAAFMVGNALVGWCTKKHAGGGALRI